MIDGGSPPTTPNNGMEPMRTTFPRSGWPRPFKSGLGRDLSVALIVKLILLTGLMVMVSRLAIRPVDTAAATAAAVAGIPPGPGAITR